MVVNGLKAAAGRRGLCVCVSGMGGGGVEDVEVCEWGVVAMMRRRVGEVMRGCGWCEV